MTVKNLALCFVVGLCLAAPAQAGPITVSTGDLGLNIVEYGGSFDAFLTAVSPANSLPAEIAVKYGLWNQPDVNVAVLFNNIPVGSVMADFGYITPGPKYGLFDVTGLLIDGTNKISFTGAPAPYGDYIIGQVDLSYEQQEEPVPAPEPASMVLLGTGLAGLRAWRKLRPLRTP